MRILYITAQKVRAAKEGNQGINAFIYETSTSSLPDNANLLTDLIDSPGKLISEQRMIMSGGNLVISYLDVVCQDDILIADLESDLKAFGAAMSALPFFVQNGRVAIGYSYSGHVDDPKTEFSSLAEKVTEIFRKRPPLPATPPPFKIIEKIRIIDGEQHFELRLEDDERRAHLNSSVPYLILKEETARAFQGQNGNSPIEMVVKMAVLLTGMSSQAQLLHEGGFMLFDDKNKLILRWPEQ